VPTWACAVPLIVAVGLRATRAQDLPPDIVAITGRELPRLLHAPLVDITALAAHAGALAPVHAQIDQRERADDGTWRYVFEAGDEPNTAHGAGFGADDANAESRR